MEQAVKEDLDALVAKDTWGREDYDALLSAMFSVRNAGARCRELLGNLTAEEPEPSGAAALKIGILRFALGQFARALDVLGNATDNKDRRWFQAQCYKYLREYDKAAEEIERARGRGLEDEQADLEFAELTALAGRPEEAGKGLSKLAKKLGETPAVLYVQGLTAELSGDAEGAAEKYEKARSIDPAYTPATFRLAYHYDLHGDEDRAVELYKECTARPPVHANALLNLAVLYEDAGQYDKAASAVRAVLSTNPNHARAKLFLQDVEAGKTMYYDEEQARRLARRNAVLDVPVTDFELSVRARNCLKKMNIRTLGDLIRTTESELLSYKNFGETSLKEIKDMLSAKGLRLGQALEEDSEFQETGLPMSPANSGVLATPIRQVALSVRSARAMETLRINTLGDLVAKTEAELLACKNFGQTSLNEIKQRLAEYGLKLRDLA
jgi:DNA-directed RNA polymerase subunit alpha